MDVAKRLREWSRVPIIILSARGRQGVGARDAQRPGLALLVKNLGKVITHSQLLKEVWGSHHQTQTQYLRVYMGQLRRKIEADPNRPTLLMTEPGVGYRIRESPLDPP